MSAFSGVVTRTQVAPGVYASIKNARVICLECRPPVGEAAKPFFAKYLANPDDWRQYKGLTAVAVPFEKLNPDTQRAVLLAIFEEDVVTEEGWWHTVEFAGAQGMETVWTVCEWLTGQGTDYKRVVTDSRNHLSGGTLERGQRILIPTTLLRPAMRAPTPERVRPNEEEVLLPSSEDLASRRRGGAETTDENAVPALEPEVDPEAVGRELVYGSDAAGPHALYRLKQGEALFTAVVVRFTDFSDYESIMKACEVIRERSHIADVRHMQPGQRVVIPLDMLSDRYHPPASERRRQYEGSLEEAHRLKRERVTSLDLNGVVVVLDPGHGGRDHGASNYRLGLYEDELNYDVACRMKRLLEARTKAKVYMTVLDPSQDYEPVNQKRFAHDTDEVLLTSPQYPNADATTSANLRWYLANSVYRKELAGGTDPRKILFTSIHADALFNDGLRGTMVYIPGAQYRRDREEPAGKHYDRYKEAREQRAATSTPAERRRDEALSRNFAETLLTSLVRHNPPINRHTASDPIRSQVRQSGGRTYVVAVLRNTQIPTKVLIETANMTNPADCKHLADPQWREWFAEACVDALKAHFGS
jgi:N-acetylmuramoyl-L-alanine amidase